MPATPHASSFNPGNLGVIVSVVILALVVFAYLYSELRDKKRPGHATVRDYVYVIVVLAVITAVEVGCLPFSYWVYEHYPQLQIPKGFWLALLYMMSIAKFALVVMFFMHLYFDRWIFTFLFLVGMTLIVGILWALLSLLPGGPAREPEPWTPREGQQARLVLPAHRPA